MGEAIYHILARCKNESEAERLCQEFRNLNAEGCKAYIWWQANRGRTSEKFWPDFRRQFPQVTDYLQLETKPIVEPGNGLAGLLDFIDEEEWTISWDEKEIYGYAEVWHCADWALLANWLKVHGAESVAWASEEEEPPDWRTILRQQF